MANPFQLSRCLRDHGSLMTMAVWRKVGNVLPISREICEGNFPEPMGSGREPLDLLWQLANDHRLD